MSQERPWIGGEAGLEKGNRCTACGGLHEPDPPDCWVVFNERRFKHPFQCLCCGIDICANQFAWGRTCGYCDAGHCQKGLVTIQETPFKGEIIHEEGHNKKELFLELSEPIG